MVIEPPYPGPGLCLQVPLFLRLTSLTLPLQFYIRPYTTSQGHRHRHNRYLSLRRNQVYPVERFLETHIDIRGNVTFVNVMVMSVVSSP